LSKPSSTAANRTPPARSEARSEAELQELQRAGDLQVRSAEDFRALVAEQGLEQAFAATHVVTAADAGFTDQFTLQLSLGPTDPPIKLQQARLDGVEALCGCGSGELVLPAASAPLLAGLLNGRSVQLAATGEATGLQPRRELQTSLRLEQIGAARLHLQRAISENGVVAVSSAPGLTATAFGPLLGPYGSALYSGGGAGSIGLTMPGLAQLGPGSPVLVGGGIGWVVGAGSSHQPGVPRSPLGHALAPGAAAAVSVDLQALRPEWVRPCHFEGQGSALLVPIAAPVPLLTLAMARQAAAGPEWLEAPVLDVSIPRRLKPSLGRVSYAELLQGTIELGGRRLHCAPACSPRLAEAAAEELAGQLRDGRFPLRLPLVPLGNRATLVPVEA
jgi:uncharacterized protein (DUF39 family)